METAAKPVVATVEDDGYLILTRAVPLRPIQSTSGLDAAIAQLNRLSDRRAR